MPGGKGDGVALVRGDDVGILLHMVGNIGAIVGEQRVGYAGEQADALFANERVDMGR